MNHITPEGILLEAYFAVEHVAGRFIDRKKVFKTIGKICCYSDKKIEELYELVSHKEIGDVTDVESYEQIMRILDYYNRFGMPTEYDEKEHGILEHKGRALTAFMGIRDQYGAVSTRDRVLTFVSVALNSNDVLPLATAAFMLLTGTAVDKDVAKGLSAARKCARWNNAYGMLLLMKYDNANAPKYLGMLKALLDFGALGGEYEAVFARYGESEPRYADNVAVIEKYLNRHPGEAEKYNPVIARIAYTELFSISDRRKVILSGADDYIASINNLPLSSRAKAEPVKPLHTEFSEQRSREAREIAAVVGARCRTGEGQSALILSNNECVTDLYIEAIRNSFPPFVFTVNAKDLTKIEVTPTIENFVVSALIAAKKPTAVFIVKDIDKIDRGLITDFVKLVNVESAAAYKLSDLHVTLDLSGCVFVATAGGVCDEAFADVFRVTEAAPLYDEEKETLVDKLIAEYTAAYDVKAGFSTEAREALIEMCDVRAEYCRSVVKDVCIHKAVTDSDEPVSPADVEHYAAKFGNSRIGFKLKG